MKVSLILISLLFASVSWAEAMDEADIPPPPMPEYMIESGYEAPEQKREINSEPQADSSASFDNETADDIKQEFLQAGEEDTEVQEPQQVQEVVGGDIQNEDSGPVVEQAEMVIEDPVNKEPLQEVSEMEVAEPEFEQAEMNDPNQQSVQEQYQQDVGNEIQTEIAQDTEPAAEKLAEVEETLEAETVAEQTLDTGRQPSNKKVFKAGMYKFAKNCTMYSEPRSASDEAGSITEGRKLWVDPHNDGWHKAYKKSGTVYIPAECLDK